MVNNLSSSEHLRLLSEALNNNPSFNIKGEAFPCAVMLNGQTFYIYIKNLSPGHFRPEDNVWRAQLPRRDEFDEIKKSGIPFVFLGYDEENDVYTTWNPTWVKLRLNKVSYASFYSRLSGQVEAKLRQAFVRQPLSNDIVSLIFPRTLLGDYLLHIHDYFNEEIKVTAKVKDGKILKIEEKELLDQIEPFLHQEYPQTITAMNLVQQFYKNQDCRKMEIKDWMALLKNIDWSLKEKARRPSPRQKIQVVFPDGTVICEKRVLHTLVAVIKYAGVENVQQLGITMGVNGGRPLITDKINPKYEADFKPVGNGLYVNACSETPRKYSQIQQINEELNLGLKVTLV